MEIGTGFAARGCSTFVSSCCVGLLYPAMACLYDQQSYLIYAFIPTKKNCLSVLQVNVDRGRSGGVLSYRASRRREEVRRDRNTQGTLLDITVVGQIELRSTRD